MIQSCEVCVVGGAGFLGSHMVNYLIEERNCDVTVVDNLVVGQKSFIHPKAKFCHADITHSEEYLYSVFKRNHIKYVFNYAAYPYIPDSFARPIHVFTVNANGALNVMNAADNAGVAGMLQVSSAEIYGGTSEYSEHYAKMQLDEYAPVHPHSSYGSSKAAIDFMVQARFKENRSRCISLRQFNCVGERETHPYVIPEIISQLSSQDSDPMVKLGNNSSRDFMYAGDAVRMAVTLLERGKFGEVYNLGSESSIRIYDLAKKIARVMGFEQELKVVTDPDRVRPWEIWHLRSDNTKIRKVVPFGPSVPLESALQRTYSFFIDSGNRWCWE